MPRARRSTLLTAAGLLGLLEFLGPMAAPAAAQTSPAPPTPRKSLLAPIDAWLDGTARWGAYASSGVYLGDNAVRNTNQGFFPLWQDDHNLLFADVRGTFDDSHSQEGNWGLGLRSIVAEELLVGAYAFYDRLWSGTGNEFDQATVGVELKDYVWEFTANGYVAEGGPSGSGRPRRSAGAARRGC